MRGRTERGARRARATRLLLSGVLHRAVHGHPRRVDRQRRAALDPRGARLLGDRPAVDRQRLHGHLRRLPDARRSRRRPVRPAARVHNRLPAVRLRLTRRRRGPESGDADWRARAAGPRRRDHGARLAGDHQLLLRPRPRTAARDRAVGRDERRRRRRGRARGWGDHADAGLALDPADQHPDRDRRGNGGERRRRRTPPRGRRRVRPRRRAVDHRRAARACIRDRQRRRRRLGLGGSTRPDRARARAAGVVRGDRGALRRRAARAAARVLDPPAAHLQI